MDDRSTIPLGVRGLPAVRAELDAMVTDLCSRLAAAGDGGIRGSQLAEELGLEGNTRPVRLLVAYARTHHHRHEILGVPGEGYYWGPAVGPEAARRIANMARRMGRCWFFIGSLLKREGAAMATVQMIFDFMQTAPGSGEYDDLATLVAAEGTSVAHVLDGIITRLGQSDEGRKALADIGRKHAEVMLPAGILDQVAREVSQAMDKLRAFAKAS